MRYPDEGNWHLLQSYKVVEDAAVVEFGVGIAVVQRGAVGVEAAVERNMWAPCKSLKHSRRRLETGSNFRRIWRQRRRECCW